MPWNYVFLDPWSEANAFTFGNGHADASVQPLSKEDEQFLNGTLLPVINGMENHAGGLVQNWWILGSPQAPFATAGVSKNFIRLCVYMLRKKFPTVQMDVNLFRAIPVVSAYTQPNDFWDQTRGALGALVGSVGNLVAPGVGSLVSSEISGNASKSQTTKYTNSDFTLQNMFSQSTTNVDSAQQPTNKNLILWIVGGVIAFVVTIVLIFKIKKK